ncbi:LPXTG-motif cell wall anchor domain protein [Gardnerella vaginalis 409-05]|nr:LPXTG-motif cell wall anchor domain protein [Gardnerella vaginalis 409-05]
MINSNSGKHARKVTLDAAVSNAIAKAVDARKVAAFTVGAAGVLAGASFAFGATPAMAAEVSGTPDTKPDVAQTPVTAGENAGTGKKAEAGDKNQTEANKEAGYKAENTNKQAEQKSENTVNTDGTENKSTVVKIRGKRSVDNPPSGHTATVQDRASGGSAGQDPNKINPDTTDTSNTKIDINENNAETMPNAYAWGSSDNTYSVDGEKHTVTFHFAAPKDGSKITSIAIFPARTNGFNNAKSEKGIDFYSKDQNKHQAYSGEYTFTPNNDGSADLKMTTLFRDGNLNGGAEKYVASRSIFVYVTKDGSSTETIAYKTNVFRAVTLVPPKTSGSVVLKYNQELTPEKVQAAITEAGNVNTERSDKKSVNDQLSGAFTQNINVKSDDAYDKTTFNAINTETSAQGATDKTYVAGAKTLNTYMVTDLGFKSQAIPLTVARYDDRIDKPIVEDPTNVSTEVKEDIKKKLAQLNHIAQDRVTIDDNGTVTINFDGVDAKDAPKIALSDLVLKQLKEADVNVPTDDKAVFVANPLDYSDAEIKSIKKAIYEANKNNDKLGLSDTDYENQISLSYLTGNLTATGSANTGISNGQAENKITVKIKTDKAVAEFKSDVKASKLTKLPNIRTDYNVSWTADKIDGRDTDEGLSWSEDKKTIIYRYDPTAAKEFDTNKILNLLKAKPKNSNSGLRDLTGGEELDHEGASGKPQKSHVGYVLKGDQPTTELSLGNMSGAYWQYKQNVSNSGVDLGDAESNAGSYSWDEDAKPVVVAAKQDKVYKARLFVLPYGMTMYRNIYIENGKNPGNTTKAINVIFVPQTNHKTSDLKTSVGKHKTIAVEGKDVPTDSAYYNASDKVKSEYDDALKVAKALYEQVKDKKESDLTEKQKADIDNATIKLDKARKALDGTKTDKAGLDKSITEDGKPAQGQTPASGTQATDRYKNVTEPDFKKADGSDDTDRNNAAKEAKKAYDKALEEAKTLNADENATQKAVDDAKAKLDAAREKLNEFTTNKDELNNAIAQHGKVNTGDATKQGDEKLKTADPTYQNSTPEQRKAYDDAVAQADKVSKDPNASQKEVNKAIDDLKKAKAVLDANATDKAPLDAAVQKSFDNPDPNDASKQSVFYKNAAAKKDTDPAAKKAVEDYDKALKKAKEVLADKNATKKDVEDAKKALEDAEAALHADTYQTKKTDLAQALADNFSGYLMPAYFNAFDKAQAEGKDSQAAKDFKAYNDAYHAAKDLMNEINKPNSTVTQDQADKVKNQLIEARKLIDTYATDTSRLSAAALNDIAIQNSPAYKNVSADDASEEAKEAKKKYDAAVDKLHKALNNQLPKDKANGQDIPDSNIPAKDGDLNNKDYLKDIQAHKNGEPLNRDVDAIIKEMNDAAAELNKFATKTDELIKSINEDVTTHPSPAFKNASQPSYKNDDGSDNTDKNNAANKAASDYGEALNKAKDLLKKPDATQKEVNDALKKLDDARKELDKYNTDTTKLAESVKKHGSTEGPAPTEGTQTSDAYRNASDPHFMKEQDGKLVPDDDKNKKAAEDKKAYDEALTKAQELLKKHDDKDTPQDAKPTQKEIDDALKTLDEARKKLEDNYKTVTTDLEKEINKSTPEGAPAVTEDDFENTPEFKNAKAKTSDGNENADVTAYKTALANARKLVSDANDASKKNSERPTQKQINEALDALKAAKKQIEDNYKTNLEPLTSAKDFAGGDFKKTPEYQNAVAKKDAGDQGATQALGEDGKDTGFDNILKKVAEKLNDEDWKKKATQKQVNALLKQLQDAQEKIAKDYKTDAIKLENEVGDKDQDGKPVTPPFEASVAYKNALEKAKAESKEDADKDTSATKKLAAYAEKLAKANELIEKVKNPDPNAKPEDRPTQKQVDDALAALKQAKKDIDDNFKTKVDKLQNEVDDKNEDGTARTPKFEESTEFANLQGKTKDGKKPDDLVAYEQALAKAKELIDKNDGKVKNDQGQEVDVPKDQLPSQKEVDEALKNLKEIKDKITKNYVTSPHDLQEEVDKSKGGDTDTRTDVFENTPEFKNATAKGDDAAKKALDDYDKKLKAAKDLLDKFDRTTGKPKTDLPDGTKVPTQKQLDDALKDLQAAKKKIADDYKTDPSKLKTEADADAKFRDSVFFMIGMTEDIDAYNKALAEANSVLKDPNATQAEVDAALKKLQAAKYKINHPFGIGSGVGSGSGYDADASDSQSASVDKTALRVEVNNSEADSSAASKANTAAARAYVKALAEAKRVLADKNATQAQVDAALRNLKAAKAALRNASGNAGGLAKTGAATGLFASLAAIFSGLGAAGVASRRRKHSNE